jgi:hypothetical protein
LDALKNEAAIRTLCDLGYKWQGEYWSPPIVEAQPNDPNARDIAVMVLIRSSDPAIFPENIDVSTSSSTRALRRAVVANLPRLTRVIMVLEEETARLMAAAHDAAARISGLDSFLISRPPSNYRPPGRR